MYLRYRALSAFVAIAMALLPTFAAADAAGDVRAFVTLSVNTLDQGETVAVFRANDVLIPISALEQAGVHGLGGTRETIRGVLYFSLDSLAPAVTYTLDKDALTLSITIAATHLGSLSLNLSSTRPAKIEYTSDRSAFLNYALSTTSSGFGSGFVEGVYTAGQDSLYTSFSAQSGLPLRRGLSYDQMDDRAHSLRRVYGDLIASTDDLGGSAFIGGFGSTRAFDLDPYAIHYPLPSLSGAVTAPAVADVYVNGILVRRIDLPPGNFNLSQVPVTNGSAFTSVVVTDALGHVQTYSQSYYTVTDLLVRGQTDFQYAGGLLRPQPFALNDSYGPGVVMGRYRLGVTDSLTAGARFEALPHLYSFGPSADLRLRVGVLHAAGAISRDTGTYGSAFSLGYSYSEPRFGMGISLLHQSDNYANVSQRASADRPLLALSVFATQTVGSRSSLALAYNRSVDRDSGTLTQMSLTGSTVLPGNLNLILTAERDTGTTGPRNSIVVSLNKTFGRTMATLNSRSDSASGGDVNLQVQQTSAGGNYGFGYVANYDPRLGLLNGSFTELSNYGTYDVDYSAVRNAGFSDAIRVAGSVAFIGGGVYPAPPITGSYALVEVPGVAGLRVYLDNQDAGRTNRQGRVLVPNLLADYGNPLRIEDADAPLNASLQTVQQIVAPPQRAGAVVVFPVQRLHALHGKVLVRMGGREIEPKYGDFTISSHTHQDDSPLGLHGEFYFENVPPGVYSARAVFAEGTCDFKFIAPSTSEQMVNLGTLECIVH